VLVYDRLVNKKKIIIDAYQHSSAITGTDRMAYNFIKYLQKIDTENEYLVICSNEKYITSIILNDNFNIINPGLKSLNKGVFNKFYSAIWKRTIYFYLKFKKADTYVSFHNMRSAITKIANKNIVFNLDLIPIVLDEYKNIGRKNTKRLLYYYKKVVKNADIIVSISKFSKDELVRQLPESEIKTRVLYLACDDSFSLNKSTTSDESYILTIGGAEPRKNVTEVISAYLNTSIETREKYKLKVVGGEWHGRQLASDHKDVELLGVVSEPELRSLYCEASLFIFASSYEGFGFSILEAMSCGVPVICSNKTSLPEIGGKAVKYFDPENIYDIKKLIEEVVNSKEIKNYMKKMGVAQASKFSWEKSALELKKLLIS
jgi:glycosyltransferase involved in cell wall biosynthesis